MFHPIYFSFHKTVDNILMEKQPLNFFYKKLAADELTYKPALTLCLKMFIRTPAKALHFAQYFKVKIK